MDSEELKRAARGLDVPAGTIAQENAAMKAFHEFLDIVGMTKKSLADISTAYATEASSPLQNMYSLLTAFGIYLQTKKSTKSRSSDGLLSKEDIRVYENTKAWWNGHLSLQFLKYHFAARQDPSKPVLLLLDNFSGHWIHEVVEFTASINIVLLRVPPGATSVCQPADVAWMRPLKEKMRGFWVDNLREQLKTRDTSRPFIMAAPKRALICTWVCRAWEGVTRETIISGYSRAHIVTVDLVDTNSASDVVLELERLRQTDETVGAIFSDDDISAMVADSELN